MVVNAEAPGAVAVQNVVPALLLSLTLARGTIVPIADVFLIHNWNVKVFPDAIPPAPMAPAVVTNSLTSLSRPSAGVALKQPMAMAKTVLTNSRAFPNCLRLSSTQFSRSSYKARTTTNPVGGNSLCSCYCSSSDEDSKTRTDLRAMKIDVTFAESVNAARPRGG